MRSTEVPYPPPPCHAAPESGRSGLSALRAALRSPCAPGNARRDPEYGTNPSPGVFVVHCLTVFAAMASLPSISMKDRAHLHMMCHCDLRLTCSSSPGPVFNLQELATLEASGLARSRSNGSCPPSRRSIDGCRIPVCTVPQCISADKKTHIYPLRMARSIDEYGTHRGAVPIWRPYASIHVVHFVAASSDSRLSENSQQSLRLMSDIETGTPHEPN